MGDRLDQALDALGLTASDLDPDVVDALRSAAAKPPTQLTEADLAGLSPEQIVKAEADGRLDQLLGRQGV